MVLRRPAIRHPLDQLAGLDPEELAESIYGFPFQPAKVTRRSGKPIGCGKCDSHCLPEGVRGQPLGLYQFCDTQPNHSPLLKDCVITLLSVSAFFVSYAHSGSKLEAVDPINRRIAKVHAGARVFPFSPKAMAGEKLSGFTIDRHKRFWQVLDPKGRLVCLTVYKCGAKEVVRRLGG